MNRRLLLFGTLGIGVIVVLVLMLLGSFDNNVDQTDIIEYCSRNEDTAFCQDKNASFETIAIDMLDFLLKEYPVDYSDELCEDYFYGKIENYCKESKANVLPSNVVSLKDEYKVVPVYDGKGNVKEGIFDVYTKYSSGLDAYVIRIAVIYEANGGVVDSNGIPVISGLSYNETPDRESLYLSNSWLRSFILDVVQNVNDTSVCATYFTEEALTKCEEDILNVVPVTTITKGTEIIEIATNEFIIMMSNDAETYSVSYHVLFVETDDEEYISEIQVNVH